MDSTAVNYDPYATEPDTCYPEVFGCLHPDAINTFCPNNTFDGKCAWEDFYVTSRERYSPFVSNGVVYQVGVCKFYIASPSPPAPPASGAENQVQTLLSVAQDISVVEPQDAALRARMEAGLGLTSEELQAVTTITDYTVGSTVIRIIFSVQNNPTLQNQILVSTTANLANAATATAFLSDLGFDVLNVDISVINIPYGNKDSDDNIAVIVGAVVGGIFGLLCIVAIIFVVKRKQSKVEA